MTQFGDPPQKQRVGVTIMLKCTPSRYAEAQAEQFTIHEHERRRLPDIHWSSGLPPVPGWVLVHHIDTVVLLPTLQ
jgi:hypothetical protein